MVEFVSMTRAQAAEYLARFLAEMPACEQRLADTTAATGGPSTQSLDHTPASLEPLWEWAAGRFAWRDGYTPPPLGMPGPRIDPADLEPAAQLPSWFHHPSGAGYARFSAQTLWLIDGLGRYLGNTVVRTIAGTRWQAGHARDNGYAFQNQPVIAGLGDEIMTVWICATLTATVLGIPQHARLAGEPRGQPPVQALRRPLPHCVTGPGRGPHPDPPGGPEPPRQSAQIRNQGIPRIFVGVRQLVVERRGPRTWRRTPCRWRWASRCCPGRSWWRAPGRCGRSGWATRAVEYRPPVPLAMPWNSAARPTHRD